MSDTLTPQQRHKCMSHVLSSSTKPEVKLRHALWRLGFRYRKNDRRLPGSPDIVLPKYRTVIFLNGCFWHGHKGCRKNVLPKTNTEFWVSKINRNQERDQDVWRALEAKGWFVVVVWECELVKASFDSTLSRVEQTILANGEQYRQQLAERAFNQRQYILERKKQRDRHNLLLSEIAR